MSDLLPDQDNMSRMDLRRVGLMIDSILRRRQGIRDFTDDQDCLFRISLTSSASSVCLPDGTTIAEGDPVIELHFWNEHVPPVPCTGPNPGWALRIIRQANKSLFLLDHYLDHEESLNDVAAVTGSPPFASRMGGVQVARTGRRFGFEVLESSPGNALYDQLRLVSDNLFLWGIAWTFNRAAAHHQFVVRRRTHLWISRAALHARYHREDAAKFVSSRPIEHVQSDLAVPVTGSA